MKRNILYLFHYYRDGDGGSTAIDYLINIDKDYFDSYLIVCKKINTKKQISIVEEKDTSKILEFIEKPNLLIHYVRASQSNILEHILSLANKDIPVVTTVVQSPEYKRYMLSPYEIRHSNYFVFIDKTANNSKLISFIPSNKRTAIYLLYSGLDENFNKTESIFLRKESGEVIYGRGSVLSKCPKNMFEVFDKIDINNKRFIIVGIPEGDNWVRIEAKKRSNVEVLPLLSSEQWFEVCKTFDVFLYQLPNDCYASIDGTLGLAISMRKPVVYMGCEAPKERFVHGESGYIANSVDEMALYATQLGKDYELRKRIGEKGREQYIAMRKENNGESRFHEVYEKASFSNKSFTVPLSYRLKYYFYCYKDYLRNLFDYY